MSERDQSTDAAAAGTGSLGAGDVARPLIAALLVMAGVVHLVTVPDQAGKWLAEGIGFAIVGWLQLAGATLVLVRCRRWVLAATAVVNVVAIGLLVWSRTAGFPLGPQAGIAQPVGSVDQFAAMVEALAVGLAVVLLVVGEARGAVGDLGRRTTMVGAVVAIGLTTVVLASPSAREHVPGGRAAAANLPASNVTAANVTAANVTAPAHLHDTGAAKADAANDDAGGVSANLAAQPASVATHDHAQAAATTAADDKGFSLLMNGHQHSQAPQPMDAATTALLAHQLARTSELVQRYPTVAAAQAAGYNREGPFSPGLGAHYGKGIDTYILGGVIDETTVLKPMLIYDGTDPDSRLVGFMYMGTGADGGPPQGFAGPNDIWHYHTNTCLVFRPDGSTDSPLGADSENVDPKVCQALGGVLIKNTGYMLHVWTVPGWENPLGVFHETHPAITCGDGTYWTKPSDQIGTSLTTCRDEP